MNESTALGAIDFYMKKVPLTETAAIIFFGGEPLMAFPVIKKTCEYIKEAYNDRKVIYSITTNL